MIDDLSSAVRQPVSRETVERLETYEALLRKWNPKINLVSRTTLDEVFARHIADSAQVVPEAGSGRNWVDLGSGGGFPGMVIAILLSEIRPEATITLVEADQRKAAFLRTVAQATGVQPEIIARRIEDMKGATFDVITARALATLPRLLQLAHPLMKPNATCLFLKGANAASELDEARKEWHFETASIPSITREGSAILRLKGVRRV